jgi:hypothetical protein
MDAHGYVPLEVLASTAAMRGIRTCALRKSGREIDLIALILAVVTACPSAFETDGLRVRAGVEWRAQSAVVLDAVPIQTTEVDPCTAHGTERHFELNLNETVW